jgi:hypothetical protein
LKISLYFTNRWMVELTSLLVNLDGCLIGLNSNNLSNQVVVAHTNLALLKAI